MDFIAQSAEVFEWVGSEKILNAGSGGETCGLPEDQIYHLDICAKNLPSSARTFVGDVHDPPFADSFFDITVCVGSVLNYCDAAVAIGSLARVTKPGGKLFVEFECSWALDYLFRKEFKKNVALAETFYDTHKVRLWSFSESFIEGILSASGFNVVKRSHAHLFSSLVQRITGNPNFAARFFCLDRLLRRIPMLSSYCSNVIFFCEKHGTV